MDFFSSLLEAYKQAEINGLVDNENEEVILPPIFHTDMESDGKNVIEVISRKRGKNYFSCDDGFSKSDEFSKIYSASLS